MSDKPVNNSNLDETMFDIDEIMADVDATSDIDASSNDDATSTADATSDIHATSDEEEEEDDDDDDDPPIITSDPWVNEIMAMPAQVVNRVYGEMMAEKRALKKKKRYDYLRGQVSTPLEIAREVARQVIRAQNQEPSRPVGQLSILTVWLYRHQLEAAGMMVRWNDDPDCNGGILADDKGLGKTLTTLRFLAERPPTTSEQALILVPSSLMIVWQAEFSKSICKQSGLHVLFIHPNLSNAIPKNEVTAQQMRDHNIIVVTHRQFVTDDDKRYEGTYDHNMFHGGMTIKYLIVDEAHHAVNPKTEMFKAVDSIKASKKILITGSPFRNLVRNICAFFKILGVPVLGHRKAFDQAFTQPKTEDNYRIASPEQQGHLNIILSQHMIRRFKEDHLRDFPLLAIHESLHFHAPNLDYSLEFTIDGKERKFCIPKESLERSKALLTARQLACHPALALRDAEKPKETLTDKDWWAILEHLRKDGNFESGPRFVLGGSLILQYREQTYNWTKLDGMNIKKSQYQRCVNCDQDRPMWTFEGRTDRRCMFEDANGVTVTTKEPEVVFCRSCRQEKLYRDFVDDDTGAFNRCCRACKAKPNKSTPKLPKTLVYSPFRRALDLFEIHLEKFESIPKDLMYRIDGTVPQDDRAGIMDEFERSKDSRSVLMASIKCAGEGLNITAANFILFLNVTYCPSNEYHAICCAHRINQKHPVVAVVLRADGCAAEDKIFKRREVKEKHEKGIVDGGRKRAVYVLRDEDFLVDEDADYEAENDL